MFSPLGGANSISFLLNTLKGTAKAPQVPKATFLSLKKVHNQPSHFYEGPTPPPPSGYYHTMIKIK